jgi:hypothetical protein
MARWWQASLRQLTEPYRLDSYAKCHLMSSDRPLNLNYNVDDANYQVVYRIITRMY